MPFSFTKTKYQCKYNNTKPVTMMSDSQTTPANDNREYGELVATVRMQTQAITDLRASFDRLVNREEFEYRVGSIETTVEKYHKMTNHKHDESNRKIEGIQKIQNDQIAQNMVGSEKIANTERVLWFAGSIVVAIITAYVKGWV